MSEHVDTDYWQEAFTIPPLIGEIDPEGQALLRSWILGLIAQIAHRAHRTVWPCCVSQRVYSRLS